jgi:pimeloyl-ACP methyl ester carboxylesterase
MVDKRRIVIIALVVLAALGVCYVLAGLGLFLFQDSLVFFPQKLESGSQNVKDYKEIETVFRVDGVKLHGWLVNRGEPGLIIYYGGNAEEVSWNIEEFKKMKDYSTLLLNYRGYGLSQGDPSQELLFKDALEVFDKIAADSGRIAGDIVLVGRSLGSGVAAYVASRRKVSKLVLVTPFDSVKSIACDRFPIFPVDLLLKNPFPSVEYAPEIECPVLILLAETDDVVPRENSMNLASKIKPKPAVTVIRGSGHNEIQDVPEYWKSIGEFIGVVTETPEVE